MTQRYQQLSLDIIKEQPAPSLEESALGNRLAPDDRAFHDWYRFVLSYPAHLVSYYLDDFGLSAGQTVLDPFCGTGTTLVEARLRGFAGLGVEANPLAHFASSVKVNWEIISQQLLADGESIAERTLQVLARQGINDLSPSHPENLKCTLQTLNEEQEKLILNNSISPLPLHKSLALRDILTDYAGEKSYPYLRLALAKTLVLTASNLHFGPEVGVGKPIQDAPVVSAWLAEVKKMCGDLQSIENKSFPPASVLLADARQIGQIIAPASVDAVITSPPYPNEKDYTRTTRLESVILGFIRDKHDLRQLKKNLLRSNTRGVYKEDRDDEWVANHTEIQRIAEAIETRRIALGKTSGFEKLYGRVTKLYFGGMARHLLALRPLLKPGAQLAYVVGDQASYLRVMIRTGQLLAEIAAEIGYEVVRIDLFRTRFSTATKEQLREEVVILKWKGN